MKNFKRKRSILTILIALALFIVMTMCATPQSYLVFADEIREAIELSDNEKSLDLEKIEEEMEEELEGVYTELNYDQTEIIAEDISRRTETSKTFVQAYDANNTYSYEVEYELEYDENGECFLIVTAAKDFFETAAFPVVIDPTIQSYTSTFYTGQYRINSSTTYNLFQTGYPDVKYDYHSYMYMSNISSIASNLSGKSIMNAAISLNYSNSSSNIVAKIKATTSPSSMYSASVLTTLGVETNAAYNSLTIDVFSYLTSYPSYIISIEDINKNKCVFSNPILTVTYKAHVGIDSSDCNITQDMGYDGKGIVSLNTQQLNYTYEDIYIDDGFLPISLSHIYDENFVNSYYVGYNFKLNYHQRLTYESGVYRYDAANGKRYYFDQYSLYNSELGLNLYFKDNRCFLVDKEGNSMVFSYHGVLLEMHQYPSRYESGYRLNGLHFVINYANQPSDRSLVSTNKISNITNNNTTVHFTYGGNGLLENIKYSVGSGAQKKMIDYLYDSSHRLLYIQKLVNEDNANAIHTIGLGYSNYILNRIYDNDNPQEDLQYVYTENKVRQINSYYLNSGVRYYDTLDIMVLAIGSVLGDKVRH